MGLIPLRTVLVVCAALVGCLFVLGSIGPFGLHVRAREGCMVSRSWQYGDWRTLYSLGRLEWRYKPMHYRCPSGQEYDPAVMSPMPAGTTLDTFEH